MGSGKRGWDLRRENNACIYTKCNPTFTLHHKYYSFWNITYWQTLKMILFLICISHLSSTLQKEMTAIHLAALTNHPSVIKVLSSFSADLDAKCQVVWYLKNICFSTVIESAPPQPLPSPSPAPVLTIVIVVFREEAQLFIFVQQLVIWTPWRLSYQVEPVSTYLMMWVTRTEYQFIELITNSLVLIHI